MPGCRIDQEIVDEDLGDEDMIALPWETWLTLAGWLPAELRIIAERDGAVGAARWLDTRGLAWSWANPSRRGVRAERPSDGS